MMISDQRVRTLHTFIARSHKLSLYAPRVLYIYTLYDHIFPYIIGLLSYIRVIIQDIVRNHQHSSPARLCVSNIYTTYNIQQVLLLNEAYMHPTL